MTAITTSSTRCANQAIRQKAIEHTLAKNPDAFMKKLGNTAAQNDKGCICKKSGCLKKYCECYQNGLGCSAKCKCVGCENGKCEAGGVDTESMEGEEGVRLGKRADFDVKEELRKKLLEIKRYKLQTVSI